MVRALAAVLAVGALAAPASATAAFPATPPNDPLFDASPLPNATNEQWDLASPAAGFDRGISADRAWPLTTGAGVSIADIDVGVDLDHADLAGRWLANPGEAGTDRRGRDRRSNRVDDDRNGYVDDWRGYDFFARDPGVGSDTRNNHGTNVAGVLGAATDNGKGIAGVAPGAAILPIRTADNILHQSSRLAEAIVYSADRGAGVMSMSLGTDSNSAALYRAARYATARGSVLVAASGNEFSFHHNLPGALDQTITVGGLNPDTANTTALNGSLALVGTDFKVRASYSDYGPSLDVVAPTQVPTTEYGGGYTMNWSGTSAATPHAAGVAALVLARGKELGLRLRAREVRQIVNGTAKDLADPAKETRPGWDRLTGYGRVDAFAAVSSVRPGKVPPEVDITAPTPFQPANRDRMAVRGFVRGRSPTRWTLELGEGEEPTSWRTLTTGGATGRRSRRIATVDPRGLAAGGYTLRLRATDSNGNRGEDRAFFFSLRDSLLKRGYPKQLGSSGEASPQLADLNGDGRQEIVLATSDGRVTVLSGRTGRRFRGWPKAMRSYGTRDCPAPAGQAAAGLPRHPRGGEHRRRAPDGDRGRRPRRPCVRLDPPRPAGARIPGAHRPPPPGERRPPRRLDLREPGARRPERGPQARHRGRRGRPEGLRLERPRPAPAGLARARTRLRRRRRDEDPLLSGRRRRKRRRLARRGGGNRRGLREHAHDHRARVRVLGARGAPAGLAGKARGAVGRRDPARRRGGADVALARRRRRRRSRRGGGERVHGAARAVPRRRHPHVAHGGGQPLPVPRPRRLLAGRRARRALDRGERRVRAHVPGRPVAPLRRPGGRPSRGGPGDARDARAIRAPAGRVGRPFGRLAARRSRARSRAGPS